MAGWLWTYISGLAAAIAVLGQRIGDPVADIAALKAVPLADRVDRQLRVVETVFANPPRDANYVYDLTGADAENLPIIVSPNDAVGRWYITGDQAQAIVYTSPAPANWNGAAPTNMQDATDRMSAVTALHLGVPIP